MSHVFPTKPAAREEAKQVCVGEATQYCLAATGFLWKAVSATFD